MNFFSFHRIFFFTPVIAACIFLFPGRFLPAEGLKTEILDEFSSAEGWNLKHHRRHSGSLYVSNRELPAEPESGSYLEIQFSGENGAGFRLRKNTPIRLRQCMRELSVDIYGNGGIFEFYADLRDVRGRFVRLPAGIHRHSGWKKISLNLGSVRSRRIQINVPEDGLTLEGFYIKTLSADGKIHLLMDNLKITGAACFMLPGKFP